MTRSIRNKILIFLLLLYITAFAIFYIAKPLSILTTCQRDAHAHCDEFFNYFQERTDGYHGDYSEFRDEWYWEMGGFMLFLIGLPFLLFFVFKIYLDLLKRIRRNESVK